MSPRQQQLRDAAREADAGHEVRGRQQREGVADDRQDESHRLRSSFA
jgi:hypothetical protein